MRNRWGGCDRNCSRWRVGLQRAEVMGFGPIFNMVAPSSQHTPIGHTRKTGSCRRRGGQACPPLSAALVLACLLAAGRGVVGQAAHRPNFVFILTDDQDKVLGGDWNQPKLARLIAQNGMNFTNFLTGFALCCPARASMLTGMCVHNHGIATNGGKWAFERFRERGLENKTAPFLLQQAGYRTGLVGKYMNGYGKNASYIPPGWDRWFAILNKIDYLDWEASDQGEVTNFGSAESDYVTDVLTRKAVDFIHARQSNHRPFFLWLANYAPHVPMLPAPRHAGTLKGLKVPRVPSYNESSKSINQKVSFLRKLSPIDKECAAAFDFQYQCRAEALLAVDDQIQAVVKALEDTGQLEHTFIFYASDNGYKLGHRRTRGGKLSPYEEDVRLPLYVRGPGIEAGVELPHMTGNIDFLPTWLHLAGVEDPYQAVRDGVSFAPLLRNYTAAMQNLDSHRVGMVIEKLTYGFDDRAVSTIVPLPPPPAEDPFEGLRYALLPNGSYPRKVLLTEATRGSNYSRLVAARAAIAQQPPDAEAGTGWKQYLELAKRHGVSREAVLLTTMEDYPAVYYSVRIQSQAVGTLKYIEYQEGSELYNITADPWEVNNIFGSSPPGLIADLQSILLGMKTCRGAQCFVRNANALFHTETWS